MLGTITFAALWSAAPVGASAPVHQVTTARPRPASGATAGPLYLPPPPTRSALHPPPTGTPEEPGRVVLRVPYDATDPFLLRDGRHLLLYTTTGGIWLESLAVHIGRTLQSLSRTQPVLSHLPPWVGGLVWAPDVQQFAGTKRDARWGLAFTALLSGSDPPIQCIGIAFGSSPLGPFTPQRSPIVCQHNHRGSIDPRVFVDRDGRPWLVWKSDDNADPSMPGPDQGAPTGIWTQRLSTDGARLLGTPSEVFRPDRTWQDGIVESPTMVSVAGRLWLFFSGNWFNQPEYAIGVASCASPRGPCHSVGAWPLLYSNAQGSGPGEVSVYQARSGVYLLYTPSHASAPLVTPPRPVVVTRVGFSGRGPYIATW